ncbi:Roc domain-containing protein [Sulfidibacter corallicola]|uniref:non-specific serine/threonine protein kinase n=1 Tax=Sulfidibacter corallicola TaxID=2818388 RepID=A0A8A4TW59_SULCO|nr:COR domain-containing protein [Sulfidibacter corallicola]QTD54179.1 hypothetical protein J3U87_17170 [Sulfidibacter corallicola]
MTTFPPALASLTNLTDLNLRNNQLTALIPELANLRKLHTLWLSENHIDTLPSVLFKIPSLWKLGIEGNPLVSPPLELFEAGHDAVTAYFDQSGPTRALAEVKLVLLGHGQAGKTSLVKQLLGEPFDPHEDQTHGINIRDYFVPTPDHQLQVRLWDFGGQEIMHATHRFFLSRRSLFVVVLDGRQDEDPSYWLGHASTYAPDAPVLVVLNKSDLHPNYQFETKRLREMFPNIRGFIRTSCKQGAEGIAEFCAALRKELLAVPMIRTQWPEAWLEVKAELETTEKPFLTRDEFSHLCHKAKVDHTGQQEALVRFFNDLGIAIHFEDLHLDDTHVLNPEWVTNGVYRILNHPRVIKAHGIVPTDRSTLTNLLETPVHADQKASSAPQFTYPREKHGYLIELMRRFELCFPLDSNNTKILIPNLLPKDEPEFRFDFRGATKFRCQYPEFLPPTVLPRLMVRSYRTIEDSLRWRYGMVLRATTSGARALIRADRNRHRIDIWIEGRQKRDFLAVLREELTAIHGDFPNLAVTESIGCPCRDCHEEAQPHFFKYHKALSFYLKKPDGAFPCDRSEEFVPLRKILEGIDGGDLVQTVDEIRDTVLELKHHKDYGGNEWDKVKDLLSSRVGIPGLFQVDLLKLVEKVFNRKK